MSNMFTQPEPNWSQMGWVEILKKIENRTEPK